MNDTVAFLSRTVMLTAYLINTHMIIQPIFFLRYEIEDNFERIVYPLIFFFIPLTLMWTGRNQLPIGLMTNIFYYLWVVAFVGLIRNVYGLLFGLSFVFFVSEYWEIPVYIYDLVKTGRFMAYDNVSQLFIFIGILSRLFNLAYILFFMKMTGTNWEDFLKMLFAFTMVYVPVSYYIYVIQNLLPFDGHQFSWVCRTVCMLIMYLYMFKYYKRE